MPDKRTRQRPVSIRGTPATSFWPSSQNTTAKTPKPAPNMPWTAAINRKVGTRLGLVLWVQTLDHIGCPIAEEKRRKKTRTPMKEAMKKAATHCRQLQLLRNHQFHLPRLSPAGVGSNSSTGGITPHISSSVPAIILPATLLCDLNLPMWSAHRDGSSSGTMKNASPPRQTRHNIQQKSALKRHCINRMKAVSRPLRSNGIIQASTPGSNSRVRDGVKTLPDNQIIHVLKLRPELRNLSSAPVKNRVACMITRIKKRQPQMRA
mmetsp:Transcript_53131/g.134783  ORF Transcript_53131/g.134783 Transcript_53131/m.134783 type:complete len:263 (-) Transcript_53131:19-807(-)